MTRIFERCLRTTNPPTEKLGNEGGRRVVQTTNKATNISEEAGKVKRTALLLGVDSVIFCSFQLYLHCVPEVHLFYANHDAHA